MPALIAADRPADRGGQRQPGPAEGLCRRPAAGAAGQSDDRPREGRRVRRHLRGHQQHDLDQSRLELHQRLPEPRPDAARHRAGRSRQPHEGRRHPQLQRQEQPRPAGAVLVLRHRRVVEGADADRRLQLLSRGAHQRRGQARLHLAATPSPRWSGSPAQLPRGFGYDWTGQSLQEKLSGSQAPFLLGLSVLVVFLLLAALYESWTIPLAVLLTVPLGICGAVHRRDACAACRTTSISPSA